MIVKEELHCHNCNKYVQFEVDIEQDGHYTIPCPNCRHEHYRVIENKRITDKRWASSNYTIMVTWATCSSTSTSTSYGSSGDYYHSNGYCSSTTCTS